MRFYDVTSWSYVNLDDWTIPSENTSHAPTSLVVRNILAPLASGSLKGPGEPGVTIRVL